MKNLKIFTDIIEPAALNQIYTLAKIPVFKDCKIRIMPDVHAGAGCVIGFTANLADKVIPNIIGVDVGCGVRVISLGDIDISLEKLDEIIHKIIPSGKNVHFDKVIEFNRLSELYCYENLQNINRIENSIGTLGGGNHFIEVDKDEKNNKYLIIHSGSRNLGKQVAEYYQNLAIKLMQGKDDLAEKEKEIISKYKAADNKKEIESAIQQLRRTFAHKKLNIPKELCYLEGIYRDKYLHDMQICQEYAILNRETIANLILKSLNLKKIDEFESIHNYVEITDDYSMVRKGAISAYKNQKLIIPLNMKDGCILGIGKGNEDWNFSAPHGAGRLMSRSKAKETLDLDVYKNEMAGIYSSCISRSTIDESPMAYKPFDSIIDAIDESVDIIKIIKPIYNFKANE